MRLFGSTKAEIVQVFAVLVFGIAGCRKSVEPPDEGQPKAVEIQASTTASSTPTASAATSAMQSLATTETARAASPKPETGPESNQVGDPLGGKFTLADAIKGLATKGKLLAELTTDAGKLRCELFEDKAPKAVANFVGLARGLRPFKDPKAGEWVKRPAYDGTSFHRIVKGFMIQGGDPMGTGAGEPGYIFEDEVWAGAAHDRRGLLCMANRGPNTNGMQFFILDGAARHLDRSFTIFGSCGPDSVIEKLAASEVRGDRAVSQPKIKKVSISRGK
jgi:peptidyl-prolyl cis-trans isomerase A (cyclophilin A)